MHQKTLRREGLEKSNSKLVQIAMIYQKRWRIRITEKISNQQFNYEALQPPIEFRDNFGKLIYKKTAPPLIEEKEYWIVIAAHRELPSQNARATTGIIHEMLHNGFVLKENTEFKNVFKRVFWFDEKFIIIDNYNLFGNEHPFEIGDKISVEVMEA